MLRISQVPAPVDGPVRFRLEGQVRGPWVQVLHRACADSACTGGVQLDLAGVTFIDTDGLELFRNLVAAGASVTNCSPFVSEQLRGVTDAAE